MSDERGWSEETDEIATARLTLVAMTDSALAADEAQNGSLGATIGCSVPDSWPPENWEPHVFAWLRTHFSRSPEQRCWQRYVVLRDREERVLIGTVGGFTPAETPEDGERFAEIGYSILPPYEGRGYATEAAQALIAEIRRNLDVVGVIAHTFPALTGSKRVMEKCGLRFDGQGDEPGTIRYRLRFRGAGA